MSVARTTQTVEALQLGLLPDHWTDAIWAADFTDVDSTWPEDFQAVLEREGNLVAALTMAVNSIRMTPWISDKTENVHQSKLL